MLVLSQRLQHAPLMSLQTGGRIGETSEPIIDPRRLHIIAFYCEGQLLDNSPAILHTADIRELSDIGIIINGSEDIMSPEGLVRLEEIIDFEFKLMGIEIVSEHGEKLGVVENYAVDSLTFLIHKLHVKRPLLKSFNTSELLIDRSQILEVTNTKIIVNSATVTENSAEHQPVQPFVNPFKKPQAEASKSKGSA